MRLRPIVGHLDADCFYVSAERVRDPFLVGKPVAVLGNQGACVIAKSYEMKACGIRTGEPIWEAVRRCPEGVYLKRDFRWYEVLSRLMLDIVCRVSPCVEYYSIDEFFFTALVRDPVEAETLAVAIRDRIHEQTRLPVTVGLARTRTLAKLVSDTAKPFGARVVLGSAAERELLARLAVTEISGIAQRRAARLEPYGIRTCYDLAVADRALVRSLLTQAGEVLWVELNGEPVQPVRPNRPPHQSLSRGGSLGGDVNEASVLYAWLVRNLERLIEELQFHQVRTSHVTIGLGYRNGSQGVGTVVLDAPTDRFDLLLDAAREALGRAWRPGGVVTHMHLVASRLRGGIVQRSLFEPPGERVAAIAGVKRAINDRVGRFALRSGATLPLRAIYTDEANDYDICDIRGKVCF